MNPYTKEDAKREVGDSTDWIVGLEASIKKWEQRAEGDVLSYRRDSDCGLCFVTSNRGTFCSDCPCTMCLSMSEYEDEEILQILKNLRKEMTTIECNNCANFKPKEVPPFPNTLRTEDLEVGMLVENNHGSRHVILEEPGDKWFSLLFFRKGYVCKRQESLADNGCQPYPGGMWNRSNWLREVV